MLHRLVISSPSFRRMIDLYDSYYSIGRHPNNTIVIPEQGLSRRHATLIKKQIHDGYAYYIIDGDLEGHRSKNGIFINGEKRLEHELKHGDIIAFTSEIKASYQVIVVSNNKLSHSETLNLEGYPQKFEEGESTQLLGIDDVEDDQAAQLAKLASLVELSPYPIIEINFQGEITYLNLAALQAFKDLEKSSLEHPLLLGIIDEAQDQQGKLLIREVKIKDKFFEQHTHYFPDSQLIRSYIFEITERKLAEAKLQYQACYDSVTGLPNRFLFNQKIAIALKQAKANKNLMAVIFIDIDYFKNINDTLGHTLGDQVLYNFAQRVKEVFQKLGLVARWGGDEFVAIVPKIRDVQDAKAIAERFLESLKKPIEIGEQRLYIKASLGIAIYPDNGEDAETLVKNADNALYKTKERGRNQYQLYMPTMSSVSSERLTLEHLLHQALEREEFSLHYQPQINIQTGQIAGLEALLRWEQRELGMISPAKFIPIAEENGLIIPIGEWILREACRQNQIWQLEGLSPLRMGVNLSARQFQQPNLVEIITQVLDETRLAPDWLELEITETTLMQDVNFASDCLRQLRHLGVHISMDDFGTGYSSLGYLKQFPFNTIKIDRTFVQDIDCNPTDLAIVSAIITLGEGFNFRVIAEGVETEEQVKILKQMRCQEAQGYLFSRPLPLEKIRIFLEKYNSN